MRALPVSLFLATLVAGCSTAHVTPQGPGAPAAQRTVSVEGQRWVVTHDAEVPRLKPGVRLLGLVPWDERFVCPRRETVFVQASVGRIVGVHRAADLQPFVARITTGEEALDYAKFLRLFPISQSEAPGLVRGSPDRMGVMPDMVDEDLRKEGIDPTPTVTAVAGGFELVRLVVVKEGGEPARLVRIRERVGADGAYSAQVLETLRTGGIVEDWIWRPC